MHLMLDLETLGTGPDAKIVQIALVPFDASGIYGERAWNGYVTGDTGSVDQSTIEWWITQSEDARKRLANGLKNGLDPAGAILSLNLWYQNEVKRAGGDIYGIWAWPASFDFPIMESFFRRHSFRAPYSYKLIRCARTMAQTATCVRPDLQPVEPSAALVAHDAKDDCIAQANVVREHFFRIGHWKRDLGESITPDGPRVVRTPGPSFGPMNISQPAFDVVGPQGGSNV